MVEQAGEGGVMRGRVAAAVSLWALAFGCVIGWGSFVMPGTAFLPDAGPVGAAAGLALAAVAIAVVAANYHALARRFPGNISSYAFTKRILGSDHAFLAIWSLGLAYLSLLWANATAFTLIGRYLFGGVLQWGFHYTLLGYDVYLGEVLATLAVQTVLGLVVCFAGRFATILRTALSIALLALAVALFACVLGHSGAQAMVTPPYAAGDEPVGLQVVGVAILAPWLFVGFETAYLESGELRLPARSISIAAFSALLCGAVVYILLMLSSAAQAPEGFGSWADYIAALPSLSGIEGMPLLFNARAALGPTGLQLAAAAVLCALSTSVMGFYQVGARTLRIMADDGLLPGALARVEKGVPRNAIIAIMVASVPIPLFGRTAVGWNADVSTLSVAIVYAYISLCAFKTAEDGSKFTRFTGVAGLAVSVAIFFFLLVPNIFFESALATESYLMLAAWSLLGILYYWAVFRRDRENRFGKSTVMWIMMLFLLLFSSNVWSRLAAQRQMGLIDLTDPNAVADVLMSSSVAQIAVVVVALVVMFNLFSTMIRREREFDLKILQAEERSKAKTDFLSTMSHDIRTPMNAIVGFANLAEHTVDDPEKTREYLGKIQASSDHLLSLINDVLEMSRIESGKMELELAPLNLPRAIEDMTAIILGQAQAKRQDFAFEVVDVEDENVWCDGLRLNQLVLNLLSNAVKYTPEEGKVRIVLVQDGAAEDGVANYEIRVKDDGIGMSQEFAERVFEAFERETSVATEGIQGTGLGMAISKRIVDLMGGTIEVQTALGEGSEFIVKVPLRVCEEAPENEQADERDAAAFVGRRLLVVDDSEINREIAAAILEMSGFQVEIACNGQEALDAVKAADPGYFDVVLMDVQMPVMGGYDATRAIRALADPVRAGIPIVAATANAFEEDRQAAFAAGMNAHIAKPLDPDKLVDTLAKAMR